MGSITAMNPSRPGRADVRVTAAGRDGPIPFDVLDVLRSEPPAGVLSAYVRTGAASGGALDPEWRLRLRAALAALEPGSSDPREAGQLNRLRRWTMVRVEAHLGPAELRNGIALFATAKPRRLYLTTLAAAVSDHATWGDAPDLDALRSYAAAYPTLGVVIASADGLRLVTLGLGDVIDDARFARERTAQSWRRYEGPAPGFLAASSTTQVDRHRRRIAEARRRWRDEQAPNLRLAARTHGWTGLVVAAPAAARVDPADLAVAAGVPVLGRLRRSLDDAPADLIASLAQASVARR